MLAKLIGAVASMLTLCTVALICASLWGIGKSVERTRCYQHAKVVEDCAQPGWFERGVRWINGVAERR
jgi:hypothetical protein